MIAASVLQWCASCVTGHPVITGFGVFTGASAVLGMAGGLGALLGAPPVPGTGPAYGPDVEYSVEADGPDWATIGKAHAISGPSGLTVDGRVVGYDLQSGAAGITAGGLDAMAEGVVNRGGYTGFGAEAGLGEVTVNVGSPTGDSQTGGEAYVRLGGSASVGGAERIYAGTDIDGDGLPEYGIGVDAGPFIVDVRFELPGTPTSAPPTGLVEGTPPPVVAPSLSPLPATGLAVGPDGTAGPPVAPSPAAAPAPALAPAPQELLPNPARTDPPPLPGPPAGVGPQPLSQPQWEPPTVPPPVSGVPPNTVSPNAVAPNTAPTHPPAPPLAGGGTTLPGPGGTTISNGNGQILVTSADGSIAPATATGNGGWQAQLSNGNVLTMNPDGSASLQLPDGATQNWDAHGTYTGSKPPGNTLLQQGAGADAANPAHDVRVLIAGGYRVDHPDGSSDVHWSDGSIVHVAPGGQQWWQLRGPDVPAHPTS